MERMQSPRETFSAVATWVQQGKGKEVETSWERKRAKECSGRLPA